MHLLIWAEQLSYAPTWVEFRNYRLPCEKQALEILHKSSQFS